MPAGFGAAATGIGVIGNIFAGNEAKKAGKRAEAFQRETRAMVQPYVAGGTDAFRTISDPNRMLAAFQTDPGYNFRVGEGINALNTNKAASGLLRSGSTLRDTVRFGQDMATQEYDRVYNRLFNRAQLGLNAAGVSAGSNNNSSNIATGVGDNMGNALLGAANAGISGLGMGARFAQGGYGPSSSHG